MFTLPRNARPFANAYTINVTPDMAREWLLKNNFNRPQRPDLVADYVRQIRDGRWRRTHQGIAFTENGTLLDGQHRLFAVVETGIAVPMLVITNEPIENHLAIDGGKRRTPLDVVRLEIRSNSIKAKHISTVKAMIAGVFCKNQNHLSSQEIVELLRRHFRAVDWAVDVLGKAKEGTPTVLGVIARAYTTVPPERLLEFCSMLVTGQGNHPSLGLIRNLREFINGQRDRQEDTRRSVYRRTQCVLQAFLNNEPTCDFPPYNKEIFPLYTKR
ncbi:MAG: hypothetical protein FWD31_09295 [Planctomycetaceae bacterium]|nr:hypothetical protein [Planctomycetaceae bacterium]